MNISIFGLKISIKKYQAGVLAVIILLILAYTGYKIQERNSGMIINAGDDGIKKIIINSNESIPSGRGMENIPAEEIKVYVTGCVKKPGVVTLKKGQIIEDAINAAGGASEEADMENINLVYELNTNVMIRICSKYDEKLPENENAAGAVIIRDAGDIIRNSANEGKVNINEATIDELKTIPGVGDATARDIILYRESSGGFKAIEDIMKVKGIKEAKFISLKDFIAVD